MLPAAKGLYRPDHELSGAGTTPRCCIIPSVSIGIRLSAILPAFNRSITAPGTGTLRPVGECRENPPMRTRPLEPRNHFVARRNRLLHCPADILLNEHLSPGILLTPLQSSSTRVRNPVPSHRTQHFGCAFGFLNTTSAGNQSDSRFASISASFGPGLIDDLTSARLIFAVPLKQYPPSSFPSATSA